MKKGELWRVFPPDERHKPHHTVNPVLFFFLFLSLAGLSQASGP